MEKTASLVNISQCDGTDTNQYLEDSPTSTSVKLSHHTDGQEPLSTQSSISSSSNPFGIDRILQPGPSPTARQWSTDSEDRKWDQKIWTTATQHSSISHHQLSTWSSSWIVNNISATSAQQLGHPAMNTHVSGEIASLCHTVQ